MGLFKILGGAAMGVVAIAALPIAGAVGTVALAVEQQLLRQVL